MARLIDFRAFKLACVAASRYISLIAQFATCWIAMPDLPDGDYPFIDQRLPLKDLVMVEAPASLEELLRRQASENGIEIIRDEPVELRCQSEEFPDATFLVYWPSGNERMHMLVPIAHAKGRA